MNPPLVMECAWCRCFFESKRQHAKTCSPKCRQAWVRGLRKAREEAAEELAKRRADRAGQQLSIPGLEEPPPPTVPVLLGSNTPESVTVPVPAPMPTVPTVPTVPTTVPAAPRAAQPDRGGNGPEKLSDALGAALRRITQTGPNDAA